MEEAELVAHANAWQQGVLVNPDMDAQLRYLLINDQWTMTADHARTAEWCSRFSRLSRTSILAGATDRLIVFCLDRWKVLDLKWSCGSCADFAIMRQADRQTDRRLKPLSSETLMAAKPASVNGRSTKGNRRRALGHRQKGQTHQAEKEQGHKQGKT